MEEITMRGAFRVTHPLAIDAISDSTAFAESVRSINLISMSYEVDRPLDLRYYHQLTRLYLYTATTRWIKNFGNLTSLRYLRMDDSGVSDDQIKCLSAFSHLHTLILLAPPSFSLQHIASRAQTLHTLEFSITNTKDYHSSLFSELCTFTNLTRLRVGFAPHSTATESAWAVDGFSSFSKTLTSLKSLTFINPKITDAHIKHMTSLKQLTHLHLESSETLAISGFKAICNYLTQLEHLDLSKCQLRLPSDSHPVDFYQPLGRMKNLKMIQTAGTGLIRKSALRSLNEGGNSTVEVVANMARPQPQHGDSYSVFFEPKSAFDEQESLKKREKRLQFVRRFNAGLRQCNNCFKWESKKGTYFRCGRCKAAFYCGQSCQKCDWYRHKDGCFPPPN